MAEPKKTGQGTPTKPHGDGPADREGEIWLMRDPQGNVIKVNVTILGGLMNAIQNYGMSPVERVANESYKPMLEQREDGLYNVTLGDDFFQQQADGSFVQSPEGTEGALDKGQTQTSYRDSDGTLRNMVLPFIPESEVPKEPEKIEDLGASDFDPYQVSDQVLPEDLLSSLLANRGNRESFFQTMEVDPILRQGGTRGLQGALQDAFDPIDASFQLQNLLAPRDFEWEGMGGAGADALTRFSDFTGRSGGVPTIADIRRQLTELVRRRRISDPDALHAQSVNDPGWAEGGLSTSAQDLLMDTDRQANLIRAATNQRSTPGFMRNAIRRAIDAKITRRQFEAPGTDLLNEFVGSGFRL
jgi:hypothetical protein